jgi:hypothetical protein
MLANRHQNAELVRTHQKAVLGADAQRLSAQYGLGEYTEAWRVPRLSVRKALGWIALVCLAVVGIVRLTSAHGQHLVTRGAEEYLVALAVAVLAVVIPRRVRRTRVFLFENGIVQESNPGPRPRQIVLPWTDLDTMRLEVELGKSEDQDYVDACVLGGRTGTSLTVGHEAGTQVREAVSAAAERVLAERHVGPLIQLLDSGQPVTVGCLTVDRFGISSQARDENGGRWQVPWQQTRSVSTRLEGQRVAVETGQSTRRAVLDGEPNSVLGRYVIEHAALRADVPLGAGNAPAVVAEKARDRAELYAEAEALSQQYALGKCTNAWLETSYLARVVFGWIFIVIALINLITSFIPPEHNTGLWPLSLIVLPVGGLMIWIRPRSRRVRQYLFDGGTALAANIGPGPRLVVLPWADLAEVTTSFDDDDLLESCELRGRSGAKLLLGRSNHDGYVARLAITDAAQQVLAGRSSAI